MGVIILELLALNALSFVACRIYWRLSGRLATKFISDGSDLSLCRGCVDLIFLVAGTFNQPERAFRFLEGKLPKGVVFKLHYKNIGFSATSTVKRLESCIRILRTREIPSETVRERIRMPQLPTPPQPRVKFYAISLGARIAHMVNPKVLTDTDTYLINPCPTPQTLQVAQRRLLVIFAPLLELACHAFGWLSLLPVLPGRYSPILLADQFFSLAYVYPDVQQIKETPVNGVVLSLQDEFLDYNQFDQFYRPETQIIINTRHGQTESDAGLYAAAIDALQPSKGNLFDSVLQGL